MRYGDTVAVIKLSAGLGGRPFPLPRAIEPRARLRLAACLGEEARRAKQVLGVHELLEEG